MSFIKSLINKNNHKKSMDMFERIKHTLDYSTSHTCIVPIDSEQGYDELFQMLTDRGWSYEFKGNKKEGLHLFVKSSETGYIE